LANNNTASVYNIWLLSEKITTISNGDQYNIGIYVDSTSQVIYTDFINHLSSNSASILVSIDTIFPNLAVNYSSRVWSINQNQLIIEIYYDGNGFAYNILQHNFTVNSDTLVINFQSGDTKIFIINKLTNDNSHITSIPVKNSTPVFDANGFYQDTVIMNITSDDYAFDNY
tara:strand:- start:224 stop:736 length:513 start_codon:yes stop_codon:yes gene_type:complete